MSTDTQAAPKNLIYEMSRNILDHFPFPVARPTQKQALKAVENWLLGPKKYFILEGPTGFGKSGVGIAAASFAKTIPTYGQFMPGAYYLSPQKSLTEQLMGDFAKNGLVELKGQANYYCSEFEMDCEAASLVFDEMHNHSTCTGYKPAKEHFVNNPIGTCNFAYYLSETTTAHQLPDRTLLICDEGHNCEDLILGFTDTTVTQKDIEHYEVPERLPIFREGDTNAVRTWLENVLVPAVYRKVTALRIELQKAKENGDTDKKAKIAKQINSADKYVQRIALFTQAEQPEEWFAYSDWDEEKKKGTGDLIIKPLTARLFAEPLLFSKAQKVLIMSATILDFATFMRNLGIDPDDAEVMAVDSEFPIENRPIFFDEVGSMSFKKINDTLPKMAQRVDELMTRYEKHKGIVFTQSFKVTQYVTNHIRTTKHASRVLTHSSGVKGSREACIENHKNSSIPTTIFSPSMTEGLDLKEDLGRFGIMVKVPYAALDPYVRARMLRDQDWYTLQTALKIVQATGRIVRSATDRGHIWILDADFRTFLNRARKVLPKWWTDSIIDLKKIGR